MEQGVSAIIIAMLVVFVFIPALFMGMLNSNRQKINEAMYLSSKCIMDCVITDDYSLEEISMGYGYSSDPIMRVRVDEAKCFTEFENILFQNMGSLDNFLKVRNNILCEMIIYPDRYVVCERPASSVSYSDKDYEKNKQKFSPEDEYDKYEHGEKDLIVSPPKYFTYKKVDKNGKDTNVKMQLADGSKSGYYYINTLNNKVRKVGDTTSWANLTTPITSFQSKLHYKYEDDEINSPDYANNVLKNVTEYDKNQVIIDTLNKEISYYTNGVEMDFINPSSVRQKNLKAEKQDFNFFTGITFLVIYREDNVINSGGEFFNFNQYTAAGFTLEN